MKTDIQNRDDIIRLIEKFYAKLLDDHVMSHIFFQVAQMNLTEHLPIMHDFWESVLFNAGKYTNNTLEVHMHLHQMHRLKEEHFDKWLTTFNETVDELFEGEKAKQAKERANSIAIIIKMKIYNLDQLRKTIEN